MICDYCGKREATIHLIKIYDNSDVERINLCKECAKGMTFLSGDEFFDSIADVLSKILEGDFEKTKAEEKLFNNIGSRRRSRCPSCNTDLKTIKKMGRVGCGKCYEEFKQELSPLIEAIHGGLEHRGKIPSNSNEVLKIEKEIKDLKYRLEEEVTIENFEEAAKLRDKIRRLEKKLYTVGKRSGKCK
ncbi:MAG: UvrB/UvrC motif-containing protein [Actinobacteria bacterium]|nr:UvrB/UvrC motif-containing protein [Actinomycetota bacterium]